MFESIKALFIQPKKIIVEEKPSIRSLMFGDSKLFACSSDDAEVIGSSEFRATQCEKIPLTNNIKHDILFSGLSSSFVLLVQ